MIEKLKAQCREMMATSDFNMRQELQIFQEHLDLQSGIERDPQKTLIDDETIINLMTSKGWDDDIDLEFEPEPAQIVKYEEFELDYKDYVSSLKPDEAKIRYI